MESLFTFDDFDSLTDTSLTYYNCVLKQAMGKFKAGTRFMTIYVNFADEKIALFVDESDIAGTTYKLGYTFKPL